MRAEVQAQFARKAAELMADPDSDELDKIVAIAIEDLELNPRTIKRYFALVRLLRTVQLATGQVQEPEFDRKLVLRAAHLLMNWPQLVQWLRGTTHVLNREKQWESLIGEVESIAAEAETHAQWSIEIMKLLRGRAPAYLLDVELYRFLRKIAVDKPGLTEMHRTRMF